MEKIEVGSVRKKEFYFWGVGTVAESIMVSMVTMLVMPIFNTGFGIDAKLVGWAITIPRIFDAITDPLIGFLSDRTRTRWGRRRPHILFGVIFCALLMVLLWRVGQAWSTHLQFAYLVVVLSFYWLAYTFFVVPYNALGYELTDDYHERTTISAIKTFFAVVPAIGMGWVYRLTLQESLFENEVEGIRFVSVGLAALALCAGLVPVLVCHERFEKAPAPRVNLWKAFAITLRNRYFLFLLGIRFFFMVGSTLFNGMVFYITAYYVCQGDKAFATTLGGWSVMIYSVISIGLLPFTPWMSRTFGKKTGAILGLGFLFLGAVLNPVIQTPNFPWLCLLGAAIGAPAWILTGVFVNAFIPDICDIDEDATGFRREGMYGAVNGFVTKLEMSAMGLIAAYIVSWSGFDPSLTMQADQVQFNLRWFTYVPHILFMTVALLLMFWYPINEKLMTKVRRDLEARRIVEPAG